MDYEKQLVRAFLYIAIPLAVTYLAKEGYRLYVTHGVVKNVSEAVPSDEAEMLEKVQEIESQIRVAERTKRERNFEESNIQFTNCAKSLNTLLI